MNDGFRPVWLDGVPAERFPALDGDRTADVAIIGAGITGLTAALLLRRAGRSVIVLERHQVSRAATAHTSAHLTAVPDVPFRTLVSRFGERGAQEVVRACRQAIDTIETLCSELSAEAGFARVPAFRWTESTGDRQELREEAETAARVGLHARPVDRTPLPFDVAGAIRFDDQALFQPLRYTARLARAFVEAGGSLYEETPVESVDVEPDRTARISAAGHVVHADTVVHATQTPVGRVISVQARLAPVTTYVCVARLATPAPWGLFWDSDDPYHYLRPLGPGSDRLVAGGCDHKTGQPRVGDAFVELEAWLRARFPVEAVERRWSFGLYEPADGLPFVGRLGDGPEYVAAGFAGVGLSFGTAAATLLCDEIAGRSSRLGELLRPSRLKPLASAAEVAREGADNAWRLVRDRLARPGGGADDFGPGEGRLIEVDGHKAAAWRDRQGELHVLSPTCTHLGCIVHWNAAAESWDCPCHGGRYLPDGRVLYGPPPRGLERQPARAPGRRARTRQRPTPVREDGRETQA
jgi:glycine/D-amino acid oxidase-like deaminating enzyme/nitrite reductase/ring-hydroxylating ferredoxin subunit